jgi:hypothetical protein
MQGFDENLKENEGIRRIYAANNLIFHRMELY